MKRIISSLFAMSIFVLTLLNASPADSIKSNYEQYQKFDPARDAQKDIQDAIFLSKKTGKRILLDVGGEWCIWCHRLDSLFIQNKDLEDYRNAHYVLVKINVSKENQNTEALARYPKVAGYPHIFILNKNGKLLHSQDTGVLEFPKNYPFKGHDKRKVFAFLRRWAK